MTNSPTAIVTGSSTGLGLELTLRLVQEGYTVIGIARRKSGDERWSNLQTKGDVQFIEGDVANPETARQAILKARGLGDYKLLVNCAGQAAFGPASLSTSEDIETNFAGNIKGVILFCAASIDLLVSAAGTIVNVMSTASHVGRANESVYCASKWAARGYTEALRVELKGKPLRLLAVYPGGMRTPFWTNSKGHNVNPEKFMDAGEVADQIVAALRQKRTLQITDLILNRN